MIVARKRLLLLSLKKVWFEEVPHKDINGSIVLLLSNEDEFAPLKVVNKAVKGRKKSQAKRTYEYVGGWYEKKRKSWQYVNELANLPTREELIGKLLFLLKHPIQKFVGTVDAIAKKKSEE
jgi:large subunit ribosomal protein L10